MTPCKVISGGLWHALILSVIITGSSAVQAQDTIACESRHQRHEYCRVNTENNVRLRRQLSHNQCIEGRTWGYDRRGIWVDDGCRAVFEYGYRHRDDDYGGERPHRPDRDRDLPNWLIGTYRGYDPEYRDTLTLRIHPDGKIIGHVGGRRISGYYEARTREIVFPDASLRVERERRGIRLTQPGYRDGVFYTRIK